MSSRDVRKGVTNAKFNEEQSNVLMIEIMIISIGFGLFTQSWWGFGGILIALMMSMHIPFIAIPLMVVLSVGWGIIGYGIGSLFGSTGASVVMGGIAFLAGIGTHMAALEWVKDIGDSD